VKAQDSYLPSFYMWASYLTNYLRLGEASKGEKARVEAAR